ncbi:MAG: Uma2 family endonuclease [Chloroflexia bacterium]
MAVQDMAVTLVRKRWTFDEYEKMIEAGVLTRDDRVELIRGEIVEMAAIGPRHMTCVILFHEALYDVLGKSVLVSTQNAIRLPGDSVPEPDIAVLKRRPEIYARQLPSVDDVLLVVEVADSTLKSDREVKVPLYAEAGIAEVWLVNLEADTVEVYSQPVDGRYESKRVVTRDEKIAVPGSTNGEINLDSVMP